MSDVRLPSPKDVKVLLGELLGRRIGVAPNVPYAPGRKDRATYAVYVDDSLRTMALIVMDLELSARIAAAHALVPSGGADLAIEHRELTPLLADKLAEVLDACACFLNTPGNPHVKLHAGYPPGVPTPSDLPGFAAVTGNRLDLAVDVGAYGGGRLSVVCLP